ncbi:MAG: tRNA guanosine(34) transglycosylase Tgt [Patescibacteria group bacterium]
MKYSLSKSSTVSQARRGVLELSHGSIEAPFFMPIATKGAVKSITTTEMRLLGAQILLSNTYHLYLRPGTEVLDQVGGLHTFMDWKGPILTDSGGFQVFSLSGTKSRKDNLVKIFDDRVEFQSHIDGSKHIFTPEKVLDIQKSIGSDVMMILDVCTANPATHEQAIHDLEITTAWARRAKEHYEKGSFKDQSMFGIVQGSTYSDLRQQSAQDLVSLDFDGYAIGGLAVGESEVDMYAMLDVTTHLLPEDAPRYLMGVGKPENIIEAVKRGVDMFDCVIPTREARHGRLYLWQNKDVTKPGFYKTVAITNASYATDFTPLVADSKIPELQNLTKAYLHHLFRTSEPLALRIASLINIEFYLTLMQRIRAAIEADQL